MFAKVLIANRGEIACRVIRTCRELGITTVAVYSDADASALHVEQADEAVHIGGSPVTESYLLVDRILQAAVDTGAEAIHPGYGLLSENTDFARACLARGIVFIGPPPSAMEAVSDKISARHEAVAADLPLVPGDNRPLTLERLIDRAHNVGFPLLLKASAGGGGIAMSLVEDESKLESRFKQAQSLAARTFGNDEIYIERYVANARHVEVQIMADTHGECVALFTRDCSVQRRNQKVIEEAPAPRLAPSLERAIQDAAVRLMTRIGYQNAGTVEFLVSGDEFFFLEVNTRLQVEHAVTEMITGLDLVRAQLQVACGDRLNEALGSYERRGHAIECRLYAEDPNNFMPSPGVITHMVIPEGEGVRLDTGYRSGDEVTRFYDPLIAKLVVWGEDRPQAVGRLGSVLDTCDLGGIKSNLPALRRVVAAEPFRQGVYDTSLLPALQEQAKRL